MRRNLQCKSWQTVSDFLAVAGCNMCVLLNYGHYSPGGMELEAHVWTRSPGKNYLTEERAAASGYEFLSSMWKLAEKS